MTPTNLNRISTILIKTDDKILQTYLPIFINEWVKTWWFCHRHLSCYASINSYSKFWHSSWTSFCSYPFDLLETRINLYWKLVLISIESADEFRRVWKINKTQVSLFKFTKTRNQITTSFVTCKSSTTLLTYRSFPLQEILCDNSIQS